MHVAPLSASPAVATAAGPSMPHAAAEHGPERAAILQAARPAAEQAVNKPVQFVVRRLRIEGRWSFLLATMQDAQGHRVSYRDAEREAAAAQGLASRDYAALLWFGDDGRWTPVADAIGPTDAIWEDWPATYGAPASVVAN